MKYKPLPSDTVTVTAVASKDNCRLKAHSFLDWLQYFKLKKI